MARDITLVEMLREVLADGDSDRRVDYARIFEIYKDNPALKRAINGDASIVESTVEFLFSEPVFNYFFTSEYNSDPFVFQKSKDFMGISELLPVQKYLKADSLRIENESIYAKAFNQYSIFSPLGTVSIENPYFPISEGFHALNKMHQLKKILEDARYLDRKISELYCFKKFEPSSSA